MNVESQFVGAPKPAHLIKNDSSPSPTPSFHTLESRLNLVQTVNNIFTRHDTVVNDMSRISVYRMCRKDGVRILEFGKGDWTIHYAMVRGRYK